MKEIKACFESAMIEERKGRKHKGLLVTEPDIDKAKGYINKAKKNLELCHLYKEQGFDYKLPEEWFYTLYYCALAILSKIGIETRNQRCTALFLKYIKEKKIIDYDDEFIERITVYKEKVKKSDVDAREEARYGSSMSSEEIGQQYKIMIELCKKAISKTEEIIYSESIPKIPEEIK
jgi:uncharacterized protein (UPF0332 family)